MLIPGRLKWLEQNEGGKLWLADLPRLVADLAREWDLKLGPPYEAANVSYVAPVARGAERMVLKVQWPHEECLHEADALLTWNGDGAVRLLAHDIERHALLLERCSPGTCLAAADDIDPMAVVISVLPRLWKRAEAPFKSLNEEAKGWAASLLPDWEAVGKPCERKLINAAEDIISELAATQGDQVLVHQDLHGDNILSAERQPWLVIDPKPLTAEREFSLAPIIRSFEFGHSRAEVVRRLDRLSGELGLDRRRARGWAIAQTVAWSFESAYADRHYEAARWLLDSA
jgi:streptomycin 6-kinase